MVTPENSIWIVVILLMYCCLLTLASSPHAITSRSALIINGKPIPIAICHGQQNLNNSTKDTADTTGMHVKPLSMRTSRHLKNQFFQAQTFGSTNSGIYRNCINKPRATDEMLPSTKFSADNSSPRRSTSAPNSNFDNVAITPANSQPVTSSRADSKVHFYMQEVSNSDSSTQDAYYYTVGRDAAAESNLGSPQEGEDSTSRWISPRLELKREVVCPRRQFKTPSSRIWQRYLEDMHRPGHLPSEADTVDSSSDKPHSTIPPKQPNYPRSSRNHKHRQPQFDSPRVRLVQPLVSSDETLVPVSNSMKTFRDLGGIGGMGMGVGSIGGAGFGGFMGGGMGMGGWGFGGPVNNPAWAPWNNVQDWMIHERSSIRESAFGPGNMYYSANPYIRRYPITSPRTPPMGANWNHYNPITGRRFTPRGAAPAMSSVDSYRNNDYNWASRGVHP